MLDRILTALARHRTLFDLSKDELGTKALDVAVGGVKTTFKAESEPGGERWPELNSEYARVKERLFPGQPMGVREGLMSSELDGEREIDAGRAVVECGRSAEAKNRTAWFSVRRRFFGFTAISTAASTQLFKDHFRENV
jgi:hypothetical protein